MDSPVPIAEHMRRKQLAHATASDGQLPMDSDEGLALSFADKHADSIRYVAPWAKWMLWDGRKWRADDTLAIFTHVRQHCREIALRCTKPRARKIASAATVAAVERLARADNRLSMGVEQWDADPLLLNTPGGVVDLRTGAVRQNQAADFITRLTGSGPAESCPLFVQFLERVTGGDNDLIAFMQRMAGYFLTGSTSAHALFFAYGTGANGKSVFAETLAGLLGDYHRSAPIETFTASAGERHPTDLAGLRGARLVTSAETEEGRRWAESRIKQLTGGDRIAARFMRQDFFEFIPQFKLFITGNHKPELRNVDEAMRRRVHLVPFAVTIPPGDRDDHLVEKLRQEWGGILSWAINGALTYLKYGLTPPAAVRTATEQYFSSEDALGAWLEECCDRDPSAAVRSQDLFASWRAWSEQSGEQPGSNKTLSGRLEARGFPRTHTRQGTCYPGLRLKSPSRQRGDWTE